MLTHDAPEPVDEIEPGGIGEDIVERQEDDAGHREGDLQRQVEIGAAPGAAIRRRGGDDDERSRRIGRSRGA